ncbi:MAG TPA: hypothetical protein VGJ13_21705 [Pseudonocardiaceae bacterium]|jgi:hypothetical protein
MLDPLGPLPESVYWRRRGAAFGALTVVLVLVLWAMTALTGGGDPEVPGTAGSTGPIGAPASTTSATSPSSVAPSSVVPSSVVPGSVVPSSPVASPSRSSVPPGTCPDEGIGLSAQPSASEYQPGQTREFRMIVANLGSTPCVRDLDAALQEAVVLSADGTRLWSSNDCDAGGSTSMRTLAPGQRLVFSVAWAGRTSQPGCSAQRVVVPAGTYQLMVKLGQLASRPASFRLLG